MNMQQDLVCRGCLTVDGKFTYIHEFKTAQAYQNLLGISLMPADGLPPQLCAFCVQSLRRFAAFRARCVKAVEMLHQAQALGKVVTKEYSHSLISRCPELKSQYIRTKTVIIGTVASPDTMKEERTDDLKDLTADIGLGKEKEEKFSDCDDTDMPDDDVVVKKEVDLCKVFVEDLSNVLSKKTKVRKVKSKMKRELVKENVKKKYVRKKNAKKATKSQTQIMIDYAKSAGFDIAFLSREEQIRELEEKKNDVVLNGYNCVQCGKHFDAWNALERHKKIYHVLKPGCFVCDLCSCVFKKKRALRYHLTGHSTIFKCKSCSFSTNQRAVLRKHQHFHEGKRFRCEYCGRELSQTSSYFSHVKLKHASELPFCDLCGEFLISVKGVEGHKKLVHNVVEEFPKACDKCDMRFKSDAALERHDAVKGCNTRSCSECGDSFRADHLLKYHLVQRHFPNSTPAHFACARCRFRFYNEPALGRHVCGSHLCAVCGDHFDSEQLLVDHTTLKHDICKCECGKRFTCPSHFKRHYSLAHSAGVTSPTTGKEGCQPQQTQLKKLNTHSTIRKWRVVGERTFVVERLTADGATAARDDAEKRVMCEVCGKKYRSVSLLKLHQRLHTGEKLFSCSYCGKQFNVSTLLRNHMRVHTGERPYQCGECPKAFKEWAGYQRHLLIHTGVRKHVCELCQKSFLTSTCVKVHIRTVHMKIPMPPRVRKPRLKHE